LVIKSFSVHFGRKATKAILVHLRCTHSQRLTRTRQSPRMGAAKMNEHRFGLKATKVRRKRLINQPKCIENDSTTNQNASKTTRQPNRIGNDSTITERRRNASNNTKKGDTGIRKPPDVYLPASHVGPKPILFIGGRGVA